jgi:hypothetical protein
MLQTPKGKEETLHTWSLLQGGHADSGRKQGILTRCAVEQQ